jgi:nucleoside diphosphate kinase
MSSAKSTAKPSASSSTAAADSTPPQTAVLLVQVEALAADDAIRAELKKKGFVLTHQSLAYLSPDDARHFVTHISNPESDVHAKQVPPSEGDSNHPESSRGSDVAVIASPRTQTATPRDKTTVTTPRGSKRDEEDAIQGLARGPVLVLALEKAHAIADLQDLVGPATPEAWASLPGCLRARFGEGTVRIGVRCTTHASTATAELAFLLTRTQPPSAGHHQQQRMSSELPPKSVDVHLDQLLDFLFPSHVVHPNSTGRLFVFGLYGPLDGHAQLRSGEKGLHVVSDRELDVMSSSMEREDILSVYDMCSLSQHEEEDVLRTVDTALKGFPRYSKRDIETLFAKLPRRANGSLSFHDMQAYVRIGATHRTPSTTDA